jgi:two-component sensor histidine kinase
MRHWFGRLPTAGKLLVILSAAVLPLGLVLVWAATSGINQANQALVARADDQGRIVTRAVESLIARNALALRIAAGGALRDGSADPCVVAARSLALSPAVARTFELSDPRGQVLCRSGDFQPERPNLLVAPGDIRLWISEGRGHLYYRVGLIGGHATGDLSAAELREAAVASRSQLNGVVLSDGSREMVLIDQPPPSGLTRDSIVRERSIANGGLAVRSTVSIERIASMDRLVILLPLLMWIVAALLTWILVTRFLIKPLRRLQLAVSGYQPGGEPFALPPKLAAATEIEELGQAFARAVERIEHSEHQMGEALAGQRKLVREVHHRVKNNLQVVASLLNIHGRNAQGPDARAAYASIGRRVDALAVVHRNHYAELEENRGIALRPLLSELAASLRSSAPDEARSLNIDLELETLNSTQDVAVAVAFLTTELVEFAMLTRPDEPVELSLRRNGDLTARFTLSSPVLNPDLADDPERRQFERIVAGLAKQLRSTLERKLGRYSVDLPVFPPR